MTRVFEFEVAHNQKGVDLKDIHWYRTIAETSRDAATMFGLLLETRRQEMEASGNDVKQLPYKLECIVRKFGEEQSITGFILTIANEVEERIVLSVMNTRHHRDDE